MDTVAVHGGERRPGPDGSVVFPIFQGTVYEIEPGTDYHDMKYLRLNSTPSQVYLHDKLAALEGAAAAVAPSSGRAPITTILLSLLRAGDHLLASDCLYGGTHDFLTERAGGLGWSVTVVDAGRAEAWAAGRSGWVTSVDAGRPETWAASRTERTRAFLVETITNPLMRVGVLDQVAEFGRREGIVTAIDNTFASPVNFRPLAAGFDVVVHSATKYLGGHSDLVAGAIMGSAGQIEGIRQTLNLFGGTLDPHAGFLLARGIKTLALRVQAQNANALALAGFLADHPAVAAVNHPGLDTHPDHQDAARLLSGFGGMLSLRLHGGEQAAQALLDAVTLAYSAPSLGGVESLVTRPAITSHAGMSAEDRDRIGITSDLIRISAGIEGTQDLIDDYAQALDKASS